MVRGSGHWDGLSGWDLMAGERAGPDPGEPQFGLVGLMKTSDFCKLRGAFSAGGWACLSSTSPAGVVDKPLPPVPLGVLRGSVAWAS